MAGTGLPDQQLRLMTTVEETLGSALASLHQGESRGGEEHGNGRIQPLKTIGVPFLSGSRKSKGGPTRKGLADLEALVAGGHSGVGKAVAL
ncbi:hypothetical protein CFC21_018504 [Triticum aestivum]|uniref:Uncharacterized protein n=3 Tax=Triticum TaxID=4564 RepID=A0A9R0ZI02_TRITD|nr:hypothetical protein CFC21_018504 [Triticum aestivum]VAI78030.1 unnamed protein product [Triticum turgidum subsp. durum]